MSEPEHAVETADAQTGAVTTPAPPITNSQQPMANSQQPTASSPPPTSDLGQVRELVLKAHPDVVPDLVRGSSVDELIASVEPARTAYQRIADQVRESRSREVERASSREEPDDSSTPRLLASVCRAATGGAGRRRDNRGRPGRFRANHQDRAGPGRAQDEVDGQTARRQDVSRETANSQ
jgi:hypothetical protein